MPDRYTAIRDSIYKRLVAKGVSPEDAMKQAKTMAAKVYQSTRGKNEPELNHAVWLEKHHKE
jgi:hypothetical protein